MNYKYFLLFLILLNNCGFKGNLYIPKEGENIKDKFGPIQTSIKINSNKNKDLDKENVKKNK